MTSSSYSPTSTSIPPYKIKIIKLRRLLHCMTKTTRSSNVTSTQSFESPSHSSSSSSLNASNYLKKKYQKQIVNDQITLAYQILNEIRQYIHTKNVHTKSSSEEITIMEQLEMEVRKVCDYVHTNVNNDVPSDYDLVNEIFFKEETEQEYYYDDNEYENGNTEYYDDDDENEDYNLHVSDNEEEEEKEEEEVTNNKSPSSKNNIKSQPQQQSKLSKEELYEQLQNEITSMATQLKQSTLNINTTLTTQNKELDNVETILQSNLQQTTNIQKNVTHHVKAIGWKKNVTRWIIFFCILGTWIVCFLIIRVIPKRHNVCLFFCNDDKKKRKERRNNNNNNNNRDYDQYYDQYDEQYDKQNNDDDETNNNNRIDPKYSYCDNVGTKNQQCTTPKEYTQHLYQIQIHEHEQMEGIEDERIQHEKIIEKKIMEQKEHRRFENMNKAINEDEDIALRRVKDGWTTTSSSSGISGNDIDMDIDMDDNNVGDDDNYDDDNSYFDNNDYYDNEDYNSNYDSPDDKDDEDTIIQEDDDITFFSYNDAVNAAIHDDAVSLKSIFDQQPNLAKIVDKNGWSLLHEAARAGSLDSTRLVLEMIIDDRDLIADWILPEGSSGVSALSLAERGGHTAVVELLARYIGLEQKIISEKEYEEGKKNIVILNIIIQKIFKSMFLLAEPFNPSCFDKLLEK